MRFWLCVIALCTLAAPVQGQPLVREEFDAGALEWRTWCPCQLDMENWPITFDDDPDNSGDRIARITIDAESVGGNRCRSDAPKFECRAPGQVLLSGAFVFGEQRGDSDADELPERLGPSLLRERAAALLRASRQNPYCDDAVELRAHRLREEDECIQRQELRLQKRFNHRADDPHLYAFRFRMPARIDDRQNSIRWVTAQWKQEPVSEAYQDKYGEDWAPSPFLAQRFDDGVLHVTIQDEHCRCKIASAPYPDGSSPPWMDGAPNYCESTEPEREGLGCNSSLHLEYGANPMLSSALGAWVEMRYRVQANGNGVAMIEVREADRLIVRATGNIGYLPHAEDGSQTKFKIGHYRDYMPYEHAMEIDWFELAPVKE